MRLDEKAGYGAVRENADGNETVPISVWRGGGMRSSWHSTTPTPTSSRGSSRECRRVVQLATGITSIARVGRVGEYPREEVGVGVGVVECEL